MIDKNLQVDRIVLGIEYVGTNYRGWQKQFNTANSIQMILEENLSKIANERIFTTCVGRTDSGVHASGQVVHFDTQADRNSHNWIKGTNTWLPSDISIIFAKKVGKKFHARFSAVSRRYVYLIRLEKYRSSLTGDFSLSYGGRLEPELMAMAAEKLIGKHDFNAYRSAGCQAKSSVRTIKNLDIYKSHDLIAIDIVANGFLQKMVRNIVGVLIAIGSGLKPVKWAFSVLESRNRRLGGVTAPPNGLYFLGPTYDPSFGLSETVRIPAILKGILNTQRLAGFDD